MRFFAGLVLILAGAFNVVAQDAKALLDKAPPVVDDALRARIKQFYQAHVDGKFRLADQVVAEDSKDFFFAAQKTQWQSYEIVRINYSENFSKAQAVVAVKTEMRFHGNRLPSTVPITSYWKVVDGEWFWYVPQQDVVHTPFGTMHATEQTASNPVAPPVPKDPAAAARDILKQVQVDKSEVTLSSYEPSSASLRISNAMPGPIQLSLAVPTAFPGFSATLDKTEVGGGESAVLSVRCSPKDKSEKPTLVLQVSVQPTGQVFPVTVRFAVSAKVEKATPLQDSVPPRSSRRK